MVKNAPPFDGGGGFVLGAGFYGTANPKYSTVRVTAEGLVEQSRKTKGLWSKVKYRGTITAQTEDHVDPLTYTFDNPFKRGGSASLYTPEELELAKNACSESSMGAAGAYGTKSESTPSEKAHGIAARAYIEQRVVPKGGCGTTVFDIQTGEAAAVSGYSWGLYDWTLLPNGSYSVTLKDQYMESEKFTPNECKLESAKYSKGLISKSTLDYCIDKATHQAVCSMDLKLPLTYEQKTYMGTITKTTSYSGLYVEPKAVTGGWGDFGSIDWSKFDLSKYDLGNYTPPPPPPVNLYDTTACKAPWYPDSSPATHTFTSGSKFPYTGGGLLTLKYTTMFIEKGYETIFIEDSSDEAEPPADWHGNLEDVPHLQ